MANHPITEAQLSLETVKSHFEHWRQTRKKQCKIPDPLWKEAVSLISSHNSTIICKTLGLSTSDFKNKVAYYQNMSLSVSSQSFVEISMQSESNSVAASNACRIIIEGKQGCQMILEGFQLEPSGLSPLIESFLRGSDVTG